MEHRRSGLFAFRSYRLVIQRLGTCKRRNERREGGRESTKGCLD